MLLWPPFPIFNVGRKVTILFGAKSNIDKGEGGYIKSEATFPTLLSRIVVSKFRVECFEEKRTFHESLSWDIFLCIVKYLIFGPLSYILTNSFFKRCTLLRFEFLYTPYSKMTTILVFFCFHANWPFERRTMTGSNVNVTAQARTKNFVVVLSLTS